MLNRVVVTIDGKDYTVVAEETEGYIRKAAALVSGNITEVKKQSRMGTLDCAVLAAMNIADMYYKALGASDGLRGQIHSYAEENAALRAEIAKLKKAAASK